MKRKNLRSWLSLLLLLLGLHLFFWLLYVKVLTAEGLQRRKAALFRIEKNKAATTWLMGDSHPMMGLNPDFIPGSFNWAGTSEYYFLTHWKLENLLQKHPTPKTIILPLDLHSFSAQGNALLLAHELDDPFWAGEIGPQEIREQNLSSDYLRWWISARFFPYAGQFYRLLSFWKRETYSLDSNGFVPSTDAISVQNAIARTTSAKARFHGHFRKFSPLDSLQVQALHSIRHLCQQKGIRLILVSFPVSDEYRRFCESDKRLDAVKNVQLSFKRNLIHLDYSRIFEGKPDCFSDPDHLNEKGAEILSRKLRIQIESLRKKPDAIPPGI